MIGPEALVGSAPAFPERLDVELEQHLGPREGARDDPGRDRPHVPEMLADHRIHGRLQRSSSDEPASSSSVVRFWRARSAWAPASATVRASPTVPEWSSRPPVWPRTKNSSSVATTIEPCQAKPCPCQLSKA